MSSASISFIYNWQKFKFKFNSCFKKYELTHVWMLLGAISPPLNPQIELPCLSPMQSAFTDVNYRDCLLFCRFPPAIAIQRLWGCCKENNKPGWQLLVVFVKSHPAIITAVQGTICPESTCNYHARLCDHLCVPPAGEDFLLGMASGSTRGILFSIRRVRTTKGQAAIRLMPHLQKTLYTFPLETAGGH